MASDPITSRQIDGEEVETVTDFIFLGSKITVVGDCSHKKMLAPRKKNYDEPRQHIKNQRHHFDYIVKAMVFPVVICGCECWTIKNTEHQRINAFKLWCWRRLLRIPQTAKRSNQSILKKINPEYSMEELMLKLNSHTFDI